MSTPRVPIVAVVSNYWLDYWTGILEWSIGPAFFWVYTFLRVGLLYIWVTYTAFQH